VLVALSAVLFLPPRAEATCLDYNPWYDRLEVPADENLNLSQMTVEAWIHLTETLNLTSGFAILDKNLPPETSPDPSDSNYLLFIEGLNDYRGNPSEHPHCVGYSMGNGISYARVYSQTPAQDLIGEWHHISGTYDGNTLSLYIDGELESSVPTQMQPAHNDGLLTLGWSPVGYLLSWYGRLDEVRIWNRCRTPEEIRETMDVRMTGTEEGLIAYWNFDEGSGQVVHDLAGNDNHGQLGSSPDPDEQDPDWDELTAPCDVPLEIVSTSPLPDAKEDDAYSFTFQAEGGYWHYTWAVTSGSLPPGLSLSEDGNLSGTPQEYGDFNFTVQVTDLGSPPATDSAAFDLHVLPPDLVITTTTLPDGVEGEGYSQTLQAQGGIPPYRWSVISSGLPDGLTLNADSGTISGTPTNAAIGNWLFNVQVEDSQSPSATDDQVLSITIAPATELAITTAYPLPDGKVGDPYRLTFTAEGGKVPYSWDIVAGTLPSGLQLTSGGVLSGTPEEYGEFEFSVRVSDDQDPADTTSRQYSLTISPADLAIQTDSLASGTEGVAYSQGLEAMGGAPPYLWEVSAGSLPSGLSLDSASGVISGTPSNSAIGSWNFTIQVSDSQSPADTADRAYSITIDPAATLSITTSSPLPDGKVGEAYSLTFSASGGKLPYTWDVASGSVPAGLSLSSDGTLTGTPTEQGDFTFIVRATDSQQVPDTDSMQVAIHIVPADLRIETASLPDGQEGSDYNVALGASGGEPPYTWEISHAALPEGLTLSSNGLISGTPTNASIGTWDFTVHVSDSQSPADEDDRAFSIAIAPAQAVSIITFSPLPDGKVGESYGFAFTASGGKLPYTWDVASGSLPPGLSLLSDGRLSGTPTEYGDFSFVVRVADAQETPDSESKEIAVHILPADLVILTESLSDAVEAAGYNQTLTATGGIPPYTWHLFGGTLPEGIGLSSDGVISGTPTNAAIGTSTFTVRVSDSQAQPASQDRVFSMTVHPAESLVITTTSPLPDGKVGETYNVSLAASGGKAPYSWTIESGSLPERLSLSTDGVISGTPTAHGDAELTVRVSDSQEPSDTDTRSFILHIDPADLQIATSSLPDGAEGTSYEQTLQATGGVAPYSWSILSGSLPDGLILNSGTGTVSGTPTNAAIGEWSFTVGVSDSQVPPAQDEGAFTIRISPAGTLNISTQSPLPDGKVGEVYSATFSASGGKLPYSWRITDGNLPNGLSFANNAVLSGTPTEHGDFAFTVEVADSQETPETDRRQFSLHIAPADLILLTSSLADGVEGMPYSQTLEATGGVVPYIWEISSGSLPDGLGLDQNTGVISGTPTNSAIGTSSFSVRVEDSQVPAVTSERQFSITIGPASELSITTESPLPDGKVGEPYDQSFGASGGKLPYSWSLESGSIPAGLDLSSAGELTGTPTEHGDFSFTVRVSDSQDPSQTARESFTLHIVPADLHVTTPSLPNGVEGSAYSFTLEATGGVQPYRWEIIAGALPEGLALDAGTGVISGTSTNAAIGTHSLTIRVSDSQPSPAQSEKEFQISIVPEQALAIETNSPLPDGKVNEAYSQTLVAKGGKQPYTWAIVSGSLPSGLSLTAEGTLQGTTTQHGDFTFTVQVSDNQEPSQTSCGVFTLHIASSELQITTASLPEGTEGTGYEGVVEVAGGVAPFSWSVISGSLPEGLTLDTSTGTIRGTPASAAIGTSTFTLRVTDSQSPSEQDERTFSITVAPSEELAITSTSPLPEAKVGVPYEYSFRATGGKPRYSWNVASGSLPGGLTLSEHGLLSGTPTQHGDFTFEISVTDSQQPPDTVSAAFSLYVAPEDLDITTTSLPNGKEGTPYQQVVEARGGVAPYTWSVSSGSLPDGLELDQATGTVSGTPTNPAIGTSTFTVRVVDSQAPSDQAERSLSITIAPEAELQIVSTSPLPDGKVGDAFAYAFSATGGKRPYTWSVVSGTLPPGLIMGLAGELNGTPTESGEFTFGIGVTDSQEVRDTDEKEFALYIAPREIRVEVSPSELTFSARKGGSNPPSQTFTIRVAGAKGTTWQAIEDCEWLSIDPTTGTNSGENDIVTVSVDKEGLNIGLYEALIDVIALEMPEKHEVVQVTLRVDPIRVPQDYATIQDGIDAAKPSDTVLVAPGTYYETIEVGTGVNVVGSGAEQTTIDAQGKGSVVALMGDDSSVEAITIRNGIGDYFGNGARAGGGVYCGAASATISKCRVVGNTATQGWGGGVFVASGCSILIVDSEISGNSAESGGGIFCHENSRAEVRISTFRKNTAEGFGGGICCIDLASAMVAGCELWGNFAGYSGGAIAAKDRSELAVVNCTLADNSADEGGGIFSEYFSSVFLANSLLWNDASDLVLFGKAVVQYCDIKDGSFAGENHNFSLDPLFVNAPEGDYHLLPNSPCLDVGDGNVDDLPGTDIDGEPRILHGYSKLAPDIGADELDPETVFALMAPPVAVGGDGSVTVNYTLWNAKANLCSVAADYSTDGCETWCPATRGRTSETTEGLSTSADGEPHFFVWDSVADVGGQKAFGLRMRISPVAAKAHDPATSEAFDLDNTVADSDDDKLPDIWEQQIVDADPMDEIATIWQVFSGEDFDRDGQTNRFEYLSGTSPIDPASFLGVQFCREPDGSVKLRWSSVAGKAYTMFYCEELGTEWLPLGAVQLGTGGILEHTDDGAGAANGRRFYRVTVY